MGQLNGGWVLLLLYNIEMLLVRLCKDRVMTVSLASYRSVD